MAKKSVLVTSRLPQSRVSLDHHCSSVFHLNLFTSLKHPPRRLGHKNLLFRRLRIGPTHLKSSIPVMPAPKGYKRTPATEFYRRAHHVSALGVVRRIMKLDELYLFLSFSRVNETNVSPAHHSTALLRNKSKTYAAIQSLRCQS